MLKLHLPIAVILLLAINISGFAKNLGNYKTYRQVTDKEILIESTNGSQILVSAYNNYAVGISVVCEKNRLNVSSPQTIENRDDLNGSIYVEELDELMQITTTIDDGLVIQIEKSPLRFTYVNKVSSEVMFEELSSVKFGKKSNNINFSVSENEELKLVSNNNFNTYSKSISNGDILNYGEVNSLLYPNNEICLVSSKGYAVVFESDLEHEINYAKSDKLKVSIKSEENNFSYLLIYGPQQPELIEKYAFHINADEKQISLK